MELLRPLHRFFYPRVTGSRYCAYVMRWQRWCGVTETGQVTNTLLHAYFSAASMLGEEVYYLFPLLVWLAFPLALLATTHMGLILPLGQLVKDLLHLPRPPHTFEYDGKKDGGLIIKLEKHFGTEYGLPSTHAMSGSLVFCIMHAVQHLQRCHRDDAAGSGSLSLEGSDAVAGSAVLGLPPHWAFAATCVTLSVCASRLYMGVHSLADLFAGLCISFCMQGLLLGCRLHEPLDALLYAAPWGPAVPLLAIAAFIRFYPATTPWSTSYATASELFGLWAGLCISYWVVLNATPSVGVVLRAHSVVKDTCHASQDMAISMEWGKLLPRLVFGGVVVAGTRYVTKKLFTALLVALVNAGVTSVPAGQRIDSQGAVVPVQAAYVVETPRRIMGLLCTTFVCVALVPWLWVQLDML